MLQIARRQTSCRYPLTQTLRDRRLEEEEEAEPFVYSPSIIRIASKMKKDIAMMEIAYCS